MGKKWFLKSKKWSIYLFLPIFQEKKTIFLLKITDFPTSIPHTFHKFVSQNRNQATDRPPHATGMTRTAMALLINNVIFKL